jgi:hypothetical protein
LSRNFEKQDKVFPSNDTDTSIYGLCSCSTFTTTQFIKRADVPFLFDTQNSSRAFMMSAKTAPPEDHVLPARRVLDTNLEFLKRKKKTRSASYGKRRGENKEVMVTRDKGRMYIQTRRVAVKYTLKVQLLHFFSRRGTCSIRRRARCVCTAPRGCRPPRSGSSRRAYPRRPVAQCRAGVAEIRTWAPRTTVKAQRRS